jgi:hypothetical protein
MAETLEPLADPLLRELVDAEKARPDPPAALAARVLARLEPGLGAHRTDGAPAAAVDRTWAGGLLGRGWTRAALIFATGVVVGAGAHATWRRLSAAADESRPRSVAPSPGGGGDRGSSEIRAPAGAPSASPPALDAGSRPEPPVPRPPPAAREGERSPGAAGARLRAAPAVDAQERESPHASPTTPSERPEDQRDSQLAAERNLIEIARSALARGETEGAFEALRRHARRHPDGDLREEREGLYIQALIRRGDYAAARARAADFGRLYPRSLFGPAVEQALRSIP